MNLVKRCRVCNDQATGWSTGGFVSLFTNCKLLLGFNYRGLSCESCKVFFCRNYSKLNLLKCRFGGKCTIDLSTRSKCSKCRLEKCFSNGMIKRPLTVKTKITKCNNNNYPQTSIESIVEKGILKNYSLFDVELANDLPIISQIDTSPKQKCSYTLSAFEESLIEHIHKANAVFIDEKTIANTRMATSFEEILVFPEIYVRWTIKFTKQFAAFSCLGAADQMALFKPFCYNMLTVRFAFLFCVKTNTCAMFIDETTDHTLTVHMDIGKQLKNQEVVNYQINYVKTLNAQLDNDRTLYDLLCAQMLFHPQENLSQNVQEFVKYQYAFYSRLLQKYLITKLRSIKRANQKYIVLMNLINKLDTVKENEKMIYRTEFDINRMPALLVEVYNLM